MKGIILAGGSGTRLYPLTAHTSKQLLPVYDKPMIYYPLSTLMLAGIREILVITTPRDKDAFQTLLGDGSQWGIDLQYAVQDQPRGIAEAFIIGEDFIGGDKVALILGDNIVFGDEMGALLRRAAEDSTGATIFANSVSDPERYGVVEFDAAGKVVSIVEKPAAPKSKYAVIGLYIYDASVVDKAKQVKPGINNELHITDINMAYLADGDIRCDVLGRGYAWLDAGTMDSLFDAASFIRTVQARQGYHVACLEEIAWRRGFISTEDLKALADRTPSKDLGAYLHGLLDEPVFAGGNA